ncbi:MAG: hypothetical protein GWM90_08680, partial [Gemmatimonadetes bacterium]|nr:hypothetical protein [Gemmatimonadota bacterium]NIR38693.1 hypothetical protein [Actinomycetota bacterium]NIU76755.1 hypothetical protein [Gammaproteobacteria bacterium]NIQ56552.1 hypothetical protein [Gemmatimonadota bacterium]NIW35484.1 hypothetical protein [Gemmatimonadota bacterium]
AECHAVEELVQADAIELREALRQGQDYPAHADLVIPVWDDLLSPADQARLLNFLTAPDGQR